MFVTFEGPEGAGKSTALRAAAEFLRAQGLSVLATREPGAALGGQVRQILLHGNDISARTELFLFLADRAEHVAAIVRPALAIGTIVLCDRHADSTFVYQSVARGLDPEFVTQANRFATEGLVPDLTLLFDLDAELGLSRLHNPDRIDAQPLAFHRAVRQGFLDLAAAEPERFRTIDASQSPESVAQEAIRAISERLGANKRLD